MKVFSNIDLIWIFQKKMKIKAKSKFRHFDVLDKGFNNVFEQTQTLIVPLGVAIFSRKKLIKKKIRRKSKNCHE